MVNANAITQKILDWYAENARELPWRTNPAPYAVWVSEIMLQQTRMETVLPYYERWMAAFPTLKDLAEADLQEVLKLWEGLGYYSRARNLHKAAQTVMAELDGVIPKERKELEKLPGIGRYTAAAISSIAFDKNEAALDGNIRRVYSRLFNIEDPIRSTEAEKKLWTLADALLPKGHAGDYNQALMDLGSAICLPKSPTCLLCPVMEHCAAQQLGVEKERPVKGKKKSIPHKLVAAAIIKREDGRYLIAKRPDEGLFGGLWEFPGGKLDEGETLPETLYREIIEELDAKINVGEEFGVYTHTLTHFSLTLHAFLCTLLTDEQPKPIEAADFTWVTVEQMEEYPMGKVDRMISLELRSKDIK